MKKLPAILIIVLLSILFLWFEIRPSIIRNVCYNESLAPKRAWSISRNSFVEFPEDDVEHYEYCLHKYGLE